MLVTYEKSVGVSLEVLATVSLWLGEAGQQLDLQTVQLLHNAPTSEVNCLESSKPLHAQ